MRNKYKADIIILIVIMTAPFLFFLYNLVPERDIISTSFFTIKTNYLEDWNWFFWNFNYFMLFILLLVIWFLSSKHWWRYVILCPLVLEMNKLCSLISVEIEFIEDYKYYESLIITIPLIFILLKLSKRLGYYSPAKSFNDELDAEIEKLWDNVSKFNTKEYKKLKNEFKSLQKEKQDLDDKTYLKKLLQLRTSLENTRHE